MLLEIHILKNYPPVNLNRDDSGAPKTCYFGGVLRGRISSQCLKRSYRTSGVFSELGSVGIRTRHMPTLVTEKLRELGLDEEYCNHAEKMLTGIANKDGKENNKASITEQIVIYSPQDIEKLAKTVMDTATKKGSLKEFKSVKAKDFVALVDGAKIRPVTADIALFGRMVTSDCFRNVDASMQVAHAISTHAVARESDYFTAVDDLMDSHNETGAGMMGDIDYNSCCYYEYASIDVDQLHDNLKESEDKELVDKLIPQLLRTMMLSNPSGKQNTFAGHVLPSFVMIECKRDKIPLSYVNAFEKPVYTGGELVKKSVQRLLDEVKVMDDVYGLKIAHRAWIAPKYDGEELKETRVLSMNDLTNAVGEWLKEE